jgi:hypothetical protein
MGFLSRLFKGIDPFEKPCSCGRPAQVRVAPEREFDFRTGRVYCLTCLEPMVKDALAKRTERCAAVEPYRDAPCLVPYLLEELPDLTPWPGRLAELLASAGTQCKQCGAETPGLLWISTDAGQSLAAMQEDGRWFGDREGTAVCAGCLAALLVRTIEERQLRLQELVFPAPGPSAWLPWAYCGQLPRAGPRRLTGRACSNPPGAPSCSEPPKPSRPDRISRCEAETSAPAVSSMGLCRVRVQRNARWGNRCRSCWPSLAC